MSHKKYIELSQKYDSIMEEIKRLRLYGYVTVGSDGTKIELEYAHGKDRLQVLKRHYDYLKKDNYEYS